MKSMVSEGIYLLSTGQFGEQGDVILRTLTAKVNRWRFLGFRRSLCSGPLSRTAGKVTPYTHLCATVESGHVARDSGLAPDTHSQGIVTFSLVVFLQISSKYST